MIKFSSAFQNWEICFVFLFSIPFYLPYFVTTWADKKVSRENVNFVQYRRSGEEELFIKQFGQIQYKDY